MFARRTRPSRFGADGFPAVGLGDAPGSDAREEEGFWQGEHTDSGPQAEAFLRRPARYVELRGGSREEIPGSSGGARSPSRPVDPPRDPAREACE